jgi:uncharacterized membrane protein YfcA
MEVFGYICAMLVGISLGALGMGGSILTIPIMVYLMHVSPVDATGYSLFVVGVTSAVGVVKYIRKDLVDLQTALVFALPSILAVFLTRTFLVHSIPDPILDLPGLRLSKDLCIMLFFASLMVLIAWNMIRDTSIYEPVKKEFHWSGFVWLIFLGLVSGLLTGLAGIGGGFIIIPALVLLAKTPIRMSVGTSLLIITINAFIGFAGELIVRQDAIDFKFLFLFALFSVAGIFVGFSWASRVVSSQLKKIFGWLVLVIGVCIFIKEIFFTGFR